MEEFSHYEKYFDVLLFRLWPSGVPCFAENIRDVMGKSTMLMKASKRLLVAFTMLILLASCHNNGTLPAWEHMLIERVDIDADPFLSTIEAPRERLYVFATYSGSYTSRDVDELLVLFRVDGRILPHAAGHARTIVGIFDKTTLKLKGQTTLSFDCLNVYLYRDSTDKDSVLALGSSTYQGIESHYALLLNISETDIVPMEISELEWGENTCFAVLADGRVEILERELAADHAFEYRHLKFLKWNPDDGSFSVVK